ncbi:hypothetical protein [Actinoplanes rectilineatus]|uniref:hypothetical protein n=1 Tax=Actinoplanes rectilineatus TaxID=113571 RepID=UPI0009F919F9|nr:hypothetical protein [Actinoplanes rectilineatus]
MNIGYWIVAGLLAAFFVYGGGVKVVQSRERGRSAIRRSPTGAASTRWPAVWSVMRRSDTSPRSPIVASDFHHDERALLRALDALTASRVVCLAEAEAWAKLRKAAKARGERTPRSAEARPRWSVWHGDRRRAALFTLGVVLRRTEKKRPARGGRAHKEVSRWPSPVWRTTAV